MNFATYKIGTNGRLCNALFQAAGTMAYAMMTDKEFVFPEWQYRKYFQHPLPIGNPPIDVRHPVEFHYAPIPEFPGQNVELYAGQMQSYKYFENLWEEIEKYFVLNDTYHDYIIKKYGDLFSGRVPACGIHVRRGDYVLPEKQEYHGLMPVSYYEEAARQLFGNKSNEVLFVICSDDIAWCKENLHFHNQVFIEGEEDVIDMYILMYCKNIIMANSSFSLLPAVLNSLFLDGEEIKIAAPKKWFTAKTPPKTDDIYMPGWVLV